MYFLRRIIWAWVRWGLRRLGLLPLLLLAGLPSALFGAYDFRLYSPDASSSYYIGGTKVRVAVNGSAWSSWVNCDSPAVVNITVCGQAVLRGKSLYPDQLAAGGQAGVMAWQLSNAVVQVSGTVCDVTVGTYGVYYAVLPSAQPAVTNCSATFEIVNPSAYPRHYTVNVKFANVATNQLFEGVLAIGEARAVTVTGSGAECPITWGWYLWDTEGWDTGDGSSTNAVGQIPATPWTNNPPETLNLATNAVPVFERMEAVGAGSTNSATQRDVRAAALVGAEATQAAATGAAQAATGAAQVVADAVEAAATEGRESARTNYTLPDWSTNQLSTEARAAAGEIQGAGAALASAAIPAGWGGLAGNQSWWQWTIIPVGSSVHPPGFVVNAYPPTLLAALWGYLPWLKLFLGVLIGVAIFERALVQLGAALNESNPPGITCPNMTVTLAGFGGNAIGILWGLARAGVVGLQIGVVLLGGSALAGFVVVAGFSAFVATLSIPDWLGQPFWFISQIVPVEVLMFGMVCTFVLYGVRMTGLATGIVLRLMPS